MIKQNPFSLYDFLGYFIPGATLIYAYLFIQSFTTEEHLEIGYLLSNLEKSKFHGILLIIISSYVIGHLLSFLSSITIEKYGNWKYGYPSKYLLKLPIPNFWKTDKNGAKYRKNIWRFIITTLLFPFVFLDLFFGKLIGIGNSLDKFLQEAISVKVARLYASLNLLGKKTEVSDVFDPANQDFHRIVTHYVFENCKEHQFRMVNYVALYGFLRNLALIFTLVFWTYAITGIFTINFSNSIDWTLLEILFALMILSFISFMGFMKFYRRYTLEGFMLVVVDKDI